MKPTRQHAGALILFYDGDHLSKKTNLIKLNETLDIGLTKVNGPTSPPPPSRHPILPPPSPPSKPETFWDNEFGFYAVTEGEFDKYTTAELQEALPFQGGASFASPNPTQGTALEAAFDLFDIDGDGVLKMRDLSAALARRASLRAATLVALHHCCRPVAPPASHIRAMQ